MPAPPTSPARELIRGTVPKLAQISDELIYGEVWERPGLSKRDRSLIVVATLAGSNGGGGMTYTLINVGEGTGGGMMKHRMSGAPSLWIPYVLVDDAAASTIKQKT